ncbi:MAG: uracil-DNA glycosylase family protein [Planctomycetaceae bacterium]|nr:uracil-DNA glycosylase family protein [Planctomycetaceae bacterium]
MKKNTDEKIECHPLKPFFPKNARVLFLGSFPPPRNRWSMDFFYPNLQNDFWRIMGLVFFEDKNYFLSPRIGDGKAVFDKSRIETFLLEKKIAIFDSAIEVIRQKGNASDAFLKVVKSLDLEDALRRDLPECHTLITTGEKAARILLDSSAEGLTPPPVGGRIRFELAERLVTLFRLPSSSRAFPMKIEEKAAIYRKILREILHD